MSMYVYSTLVAHSRTRAHINNHVRVHTKTLRAYQVFDGVIEKSAAFDGIDVSNDPERQRQNTWILCAK